MKKRALIILGVLLTVNAFDVGMSWAKEKKLTYNLYAREGGKSRESIATTTLQYKDLPEGRTAISRQKTDKGCEGDDEFILDQNNSVVSWTRKCGDSTDMVLERQGDAVTVKGTLNGKKITKKIELGDRALHIYPEYSLSKFAMSGEPKINFWTFRRDKMEKLPMQAVNMGKMKIKVNGKKVTVIKVYYSITPKIREKYYHHNFYYRKSDGLYVKKEEMEGKVEELVKDK